MDYDGAAGVATYTGSAKLWQDQTQVQGDVIVVDDRSGNLTARGHVRSVMFFDKTDAKTKKKQAVQTTATGDTMVYEEATPDCDLYDRADRPGAPGRRRGGRDRRSDSAVPEGGEQRARPRRGRRQGHGQGRLPHRDGPAFDLHAGGRDLRHDRNSGRSRGAEAERVPHQRRHHTDVPQGRGSDDHGEQPTCR